MQPILGDALLNILPSTPKTLLKFLERFDFYAKQNS